MLIINIVLMIGILYIPFYFLEVLKIDGTSNTYAL